VAKMNKKKKVDLEFKMAANEIVSQMKKDKGVLLVLYGKGSKSNQ
jgi:hypothetical protein